MTNLKLHGQLVESVFELLGDRENDMTYSLGWALAQSPSFLSRILKEIDPRIREHDEATIDLQRTGKGGDRGITDIEITVPGNAHVIIEAKRGWNSPDEAQLKTYAGRFKGRTEPITWLVALHERSSLLPRNKLPDVGGVRVRALSWAAAVRAATEAAAAASNHAEKRLLRELAQYLEKVRVMQHVESNMVYVVSLGHGYPTGWSITWKDIVNERQRYFHPVGNRWPNEPPNYIAFRYDGRLQSIHYIESAVVETRMRDVFPEAAAETWNPHFVYALGPPIAPPARVPSGKRIQRSARVWCMLDTLFTSDTISAALDETDRRRKKASEA